MSIPAPSTERFQLAESIACWWREWLARRRGMAELASLAHEDLARMAQDVGVEPTDLPVLAGKWPNSADLLSRRMHELGLDPVEVAQTEPRVTRDLQRVCSLCGSKRRCRHDLARQPPAPGWRRYCPNAGTIDALMAERAGRSRAKAA